MDASTATSIATRLEALFGVGFRGSIEEFEGGRYLSIRPLEPARPNGFAIAVARTPSRIEATFRPDSFSKGLLRQMSAADAAMRATFDGLRVAAEKAGSRVNLIVGGEVVGIEAPLPNTEWTSFELDCDIVAREESQSPDQTIQGLSGMASTCTGLILSLLPLEEVLTAEEAVVGLPEGAKVSVQVNRYERNPINRATCLAHYGFSCQICRMDFGSVYGDLGTNFIEVHHIVPVSQLGESYRIDPIKDLIPVCCNCHAMLHRTDPPLPPESLRTVLSSPRTHGHS